MLRRYARHGGRVAAFMVCVALSREALAQELQGLVVRVHAGDRLVVRAPDRETEVKLTGISAPPVGVLCGEASRRSLTDLCYGKAATVMPTGTTLEGIPEAEVSCAGRRADEMQLRRGMARLAARLEGHDTQLSEAEQRARAAGLGIWGSCKEPVLAPQPTAPRVPGS